MNNFQIPIYLPVTFNHLKDINDLARKTLKYYGAKPIENDSLYLQLLNFYSKHIEQRPREVIVSKFLKVPDEYKNGYEQLVQKIQLGQNLNQYLTSKIEEPNFNDTLLNTEGLFHFHLGEKLDKKLDNLKNRYFKKTTDILIAKVTPNKIYLLTIEPHASTDWNEKDFGSLKIKPRHVTFFHDKYLKIMANEFPELIRNRKLTNTQPTVKLDTKEKVILKSQKITSITSVGDDCYIDIPTDGMGNSIHNLSMNNLFANSVARDMKYSIKPHLHTLELTNLQEYEIQLFSFKDIRNKIYRIKTNSKVIATVININNKMTIVGTVRPKKIQGLKEKTLSAEIEDTLFYSI